MNGTAQAATNASTIESGLGPSMPNEKQQKQFPKKKASVKVGGWEQSQLDVECRTTRSTKQKHLAFPFVFSCTVRTTTTTKKEMDLKH